MRFQKTRIIFVAVALMAGLFLAVPLLAQDDPDVQSVWPSSAIQGTYDLNVEIQGNNFGRGAIVRFLPHCDKPTADPEAFCNNPAPGVSVGEARAKGSTRLNVKVDIAADAYVGEIDVEVELFGRKGKGTTMFRVESSANGVAKGDCNLNFVAMFDDLTSDGLRGDGVLNDDGLVTYPALGGWGFRLDTNGSQKLEGGRGERQVILDFDAHDPDADCDSEDPRNPAVATGFCAAYKGIDLRIEHQVQERPGLCYIPWDDDSDPDNDPFIDQAVLVTFMGDDGGALFNPERKRVEPATLILDYGCRQFQVDPVHYRPEWRARVTRHSEWEWSIEGTTACLHTQSQPAVLWDEYDETEGDYVPVEINMPFRIWITDVNKPAEP